MRLRRSRGPRRAAAATVSHKRPACPSTSRNALLASGICGVPVGLGELRLLEGLQLEGCPLEQPYRALYDTNPLLLVQVGCRCPAADGGL